MGKPATLLEALCGHALSLGAESIEVEYKDRHEWVYARQGNVSFGIASYKSSSADAKELRAGLYSAAKKPRRTVIAGQVYIKIHRQAPAENDLQRYFRVSPPAVHEMIKTLERNGLIEKNPGQARSIRLLVQLEHLPHLE